MPARLPSDEKRRLVWGSLSRFKNGVSLTCEYVAGLFSYSYRVAYSDADGLWRCCRRRHSSSLGHADARIAQT